MRNLFAIIFVSGAVMLAGCGDDKSTTMKEMEKASAAAKDAAVSAKKSVENAAGSAKDAVVNQANKSTQGISNFAGDRLNIDK